MQKSLSQGWPTVERRVTTWQRCWAASTLPRRRDMPVAVDTAARAFTPQDARLTAFTAKIGASDVRASGSFENLAGWMLRDQDLRGRATVTRKLAALKAADKLRDQTKQQTDRVVREVDARADSIVARARQLTVPPAKG